MSDKKLRVVADKFDKFMDNNMFMDSGNTIPVDMYGRRVWKDKNESNLQEAADDIQEYYRLDGEAGFANENEKSEGE